MSDLRNQIVGACPACGGDGYLGDSLCPCSIRFRVYNRLVSGGFNKGILDFVSSPQYTYPMMESGYEFVEYFIQNPFLVMDKGLGLFIYSKENGRGKTTLAHYLSYVFAWPFSYTENYRRDRTYAFVDMHKLLEEFEKPGFDLWKSTMLVIDDLGIENRSGWRKDAVVSMLHRILHFRRDSKLPTLITSNYGPTSLSGFYGSILDSVLEIRPDGVIGGKVFRQVEVGGGEDFRLSPESTEWPQ